jgi:hypothetical protein
MAEFTPKFAPVVVLLFLGSLLLIGCSFVLLLYGMVRRSSFFAKLGAGTALTISVGYFVLLGGVSFASSERVLPRGGQKYFCEIDCHLAYSIVDVQSAAALGPEMQQVTAHGNFQIVRVKTWFDENTISPNRGNGPLTPNRRRVLLVDDRGRSFLPAPDGQIALARINGPSMPFTQPLRPGESYTTELVFDVPNDAQKLRLLIIEDDPETHFVIGHENSLLHKKIYLSLDATQTLPSQGLPVTQCIDGTNHMGKS